MSKNITARQALQASLGKRVSTQAVSNHILNLDAASEFPKDLLAEMKVLASESAHGMREDYAPVDDAKDQLLVLAELFPEVDSLRSVAEMSVYDNAYVAELHSVLGDLRLWLGLSSDASAEVALTTRFGADASDWTVSSATSKKAYVKRLRAVASFEKKVARVEDAVISRNGLMTAKSRLARIVNADKLNDVALAYVAYVTARANRRTRFQLDAQSKAFDKVVDKLFKLLPADTAWEEVVLVSPIESLFRRLSQAQLASSVSLFHQEMVFWGTQLEKEWDALTEGVKKSGVVRRGTNSTDFNSYAGAFNTMRSAWIASMSAAGLNGTFDLYLPGKAVRLLAADLVRWNSYEGGSVSVDFDLFHKLPYPWAVLSGEATLNRQDMVDAGLLTEARLAETGWISTRSGLEFEVPEPDPALVHGVTVTNPDFAELLRKIGVFSAKPLNLKALDEFLV